MYEYNYTFEYRYESELNMISRVQTITAKRNLKTIYNYVHNN